MRFSHSFEVARSLDDVWEVLTAPDGAKRYASSIESIELLSGPREGVGKQRLRVTRPGRIPAYLDVDVHAYERPYRYATRVVSAENSIDVEYSLSRAGLGTRVDARAELLPRWFTVWLWPLNRFVMKRGMRDILTRLQRHLDEGRDALYR